MVTLLLSEFTDAIAEEHCSRLRVNLCIGP